jgi:hypothetical protein
VAALVVALAQPQRPAVEDRVAVLIDVSGQRRRRRPEPGATLARGLGGDASSTASPATSPRRRRRVDAGDDAAAGVDPGAPTWGAPSRSRSPTAPGGSC